VRIKMLRWPATDCWLRSFSAARLVNSAKASDNSRYSVNRRLKLREQVVG
jgi:hypothetical protein